MAVNPSTLDTLRSNRMVVHAAVAAAIAVFACALVAIAWMLGWIPSSASAPRASSAIDPTEALAPGETLVTAPAAPTRQEPLMPTYSQPTPPPPAPVTADPPPERPAVAIAPAPRKPAITPREPERRNAEINPDAPSTDPTAPLRSGQLERYRYAEAAQPAPRTPSYARRDRYAETPTGVVASITSYDPALWDVRVRLDAGGAHVFRFRRLPPFHIGDRVRIDGTRLMHD